MPFHEELVPKHGGYRNLKSFQIAQLAYDVTVRFCELYVDRFSRTRDQMVQAARSGVQNIAEGSQASGTSRKMELKLTNVARASLEELRLDYEDFLRQRGLPQWPTGHPALERFKARRCASLQEVQAWAGAEKGGGCTDSHGLPRTDTDTDMASSRSVRVGASPCESVHTTSLPYSCLVANAALSLLNLACYLLDRQVERLANDFTREGGFTERLYRVRTAARKRTR
ncbi:four helix bundle suffix domain-containing protein [Desulfoplanes sp.]